MPRDHADLLLLLARALAAHSGDERWPALCRAAVTGLAARDGSIALVVAGRPEFVCATSDRVGEFDAAQEIAGEGPVFEVMRSGGAVLAPGADAVARRWSRLGAIHDTLAVGPVCAAPMLAEATEVVGVLTVHHDLGGDLGRSLHGPASAARSAALADVQFVANTVGALVLSDVLRPDQEQARWSDRDRLSQATGMVVAQAGLSPEDAIALIRARAFVEATTVGEISRRVLARELDLGPGSTAVDDTGDES